MPKCAISKAIILIILAILMGIKTNNYIMAAPETIVVPSPRCDTIQKAINLANVGDIIMVSSGVYRENLIVNKTISIIGENPANTIIDGGGGGHVVNVISSNVVISGFTIQNGTGELYSFCGISITRCNFVVMSNNIIRKNYYGLQLSYSKNCRIFNNLIMDNLYTGIKISESKYNLFYENTIRENFMGLWCSKSLQNTLHHNNFINNTNQLQIFASTMTWDNGSEGNFWSDFEGVDADPRDGIADSQYPTAGDQYPLMGTFKNFTFAYQSQTYFLSTICNSTISNFQFDETRKEISFEVAGSNTTKGFCRITALTNHTVLVDGNKPPYFINWTISPNAYSYFTYGHTDTIRKVTVTLALPESVISSPSLPIKLAIAVTVVIVAGASTIIAIKRRTISKKHSQKVSGVLGNYYKRC